MVQNEDQNFAYANTYSEDYTYTLRISPFSNMNLNVTGSKNESKSSSFSIDPNTSGYSEIFPISVGSMTYTTIGISSLFQDISKKNTSTFLQLKKDFADPLDKNEYYVQKFLEAYTLHSVGDLFKAIPLPNWQWNMSLEVGGKIVQKIELSNSYTSLFNTGSYQNNIPNTDEEGNEISGTSDKHFQSVTITDQFSPLLGVGLTIFDNHTILSNYNFSRNVVFGVANLSLAEVERNEWTNTYTYTIPFSWKSGLFSQDTEQITSSIVLGLNVSYTKDVNTTRTINEGNFQLVSGQRVWTYRLEATMNITKNLVGQLYYDQKMTSPLISTIYPTSSIQSGINLQYTGSATGQVSQSRAHVVCCG